MCEGDTLAYIAEMFDVTVEELKDGMICQVSILYPQDKDY